MSVRTEEAEQWLKALIWPSRRTGIGISESAQKVGYPVHAYNPISEEAERGSLGLVGFQSSQENMINKYKYKQRPDSKEMQRVIEENAQHNFQINCMAISRCICTHGCTCTPRVSGADI